MIGPLRPAESPKLITSEEDFIRKEQNIITDAIDYIVNRLTVTHQIPMAKFFDRPFLYQQTFSTGNWNAIIEKVKNTILLNEQPITKPSAEKEEAFYKKLAPIYSILNPKNIIFCSQIDDKRLVFEMAKHDAQYDKYFPAHIEEYGIKEEKELIEIAKIAAKNKNSYLAEHIQKFKITNEQALIEIAEISAQYDNALPTFIQRFNIKDEKQRIRIAQVALQEHPIRLIFSIKNFEINNESERIALAKLAAQKDGYTLSENIKEFDIKSPKELINIAKIATSNNTAVSTQIKNYNITDQEALIEIAKIDAQHPRSWISENIKNYNIKSEVALIEIAKIAASHYGGAGAVSMMISHYNIRDQKGLIEIAKIAAKQNGLETSRYLWKYGIQDENARIEIATLAIQQNGDAASCIKNYNIQNKKALFEIAKQGAKEHGGAIATNIINFNIEDLDELIEIAKLAARSYPLLTSMAFKNFRILDMTAIKQIFLIAFSSSQGKDPIYINVYSVDQPFIQFFSPLLEPNTNNAIAKVKSSSKLQWPDKFNSLYHIIDEEKDDHSKRVLLSWLSYVFGMLHVNNIENKMIASIMPLLEKIMRYQEPKMRYILTDLLVDLVINEKSFTFLEELVNAKPVHSFLPAILLTALRNQGVQEKSCKALIEQISSYRNFRDVKHGKPLMDFLYTLVNSKKLDPSDKDHLLHCILPKVEKENKKVNLKKSIGIFNAVQGIIQCNSEESLSAKALAELSNNFDLAYLNVFKKIIPISDIHDFTEKFNATFGTFRNPSAILLYAGRLNQLPSWEKEKVFPVLINFVESVLKGSFKKDRNDMEKSVHLKKVFEKREDLQKEWQEDICMDLEELIVKTQEKSSTDFKKLLCQSLNDLHFPNMGLLSYGFTRFIKDPDYSSEALLQQLEKEVSDIKEDSQPKLLKDHFLLQIFCIKLCNPKLNSKQQLEILLEMKKLKGLGELENDIKGFIDGLSNARSKTYTNWQCVLTDAPGDLLLCGTEVKGSCQRVDGDPQLNKCLLAYLQDGKNRLLAIKDSNGTIIARSIVRLLWDDGKQVPVLEMERSYPSIIEPELESALRGMAKQCAKKFRLSLVSKEIVSEEVYKGDIVSLGGRALYEYVDSVSGINKDGLFTINDPYLIS